jgi:Phage head-tail joining protein
MSTRSIMTQRAAIERNTPVSDGGGGYNDSWAEIASAVPCRAWAPSARTVVFSDRPGVQDTRIVLMTKDTDVHEGDRLTSINDRKDNQVFDGPLIVDSIITRADHLSLITRKII